MELHFNPDSMANIIAIKGGFSISGVNIRINSDKECDIIVEHHNHIIKFQEFRYGLVYYDTPNKLISHIFF